jgi:CHAT domain-containing protein/tetratricopeptide (TPR) repeat protein
MAETRDAAAGLLALALARPQEALDRAAALLEDGPDPAVAAYALQATGIVLRDRGRMPEALEALRAGLRLARSSGETDRVADVRATLGAALAMDGRTAAGLRQLGLAVAGARGRTLTTVLVRRAFVVQALGRQDEALADVRRALDRLRRAPDPVWEARAWNIRSLAELAQGRADAAERSILRAGALYREMGQDLEAVHTVHNRAELALCRGDLPGALARYEEAGAGYAALGVLSPELAGDRCVALLAAGLSDEAVRVAGLALARRDLQARHRAQLLLWQAVGWLGVDVARAADTALQAGTLFRRQHRPWWRARAELVSLRARYAGGERSRRLLLTARDVADRLTEVRAEETPLALLLAGRLARAMEDGSAHRFLAAGARYRRRGAPWTRAVGWLAAAEDRELTGRVTGVLRACARGLDAVEEYQATLGSSELRALATGHGDELSALAVRHVLDHGDPRTLLRWSERWRATALAQAPVRPSADPRLAGRMTALRDNARRLSAARDEGAEAAMLEQEQTRLEQEVHRLLRTRSAGAGTRGRLDLAELLEALDGRRAALVELVEADGFLHAVVARRGRVRRFAVGPVESAVRAVDAARFALRQTARGRPAPVTPAGDRLEAALLGSAVRALGDDPVVVCPPSRLHAVPWGLLPSLRGRPVTSAPSAWLWLRAQGRRRSGTAPVVLLAGPGLGTGGAEVPVLAARYPAARVLRRGTATVEAALAALDGAGLAHVAAHGHFRKDSPMFSSLDLDDGPLTVHDFERLGAAPYRVVLSACDSGVMRPVGSGELLGLGAALLSLGTASLVSSVAEVDDAATVPAMLCLHEALAAGSSSAEALLTARDAARGDRVAEATAACFVAIGA